MTKDLISFINKTTNKTGNLLATFANTLENVDVTPSFERLGDSTLTLFSKGQSLANKFQRMIKQNDKYYIVREKFNQANEEMTHVINGRELCITITSETNDTSRKNETTVTIPEGFDLDKVETRYNANAKIMAFIFPRIKEEPKDTDTVSQIVNEVKNAVPAETVKAVADVLENAIEEFKNVTEEVITKKATKKKKTSKKKVTNKE